MTSQTITNSTFLAESTKPGSRSESLRERLIPDLAYEVDVAAALAVSRRTVQRLGLPFERVGRRRAYRVSESRKVLRRRIARKPPEEAGHRTVADLDDGAAAPRCGPRRTVRTGAHTV